MDLMSPFNQLGLETEESQGLLDDHLEVAKPFKSHGFSSDQAQVGSSEWLAVDGLVNASDSVRKMPSPGEIGWWRHWIPMSLTLMTCLDDLETMAYELWLHWMTHVIPVTP